MRITTIGLDIAKNVFQVHAIDSDEKVVVRKQLRRCQVLGFFQELPPCLVGLETCATSHYWARELAKLGHEVRLMPAKDVKAYVKRNKNDAADAEAICEAVRRPTMRFVQVKSAEQQAQLMQHRARDLLMHQRTQLINALRSHLAELGIIAPQGREGIKELLAIIADDANTHLPNDARASLIVLAAQLQALQTTIGAFEKRITVQHRATKESKRLQTIPGIGAIGASAIAATVTNSEDLPIRARLCCLDWAGGATNVDRRESETRADIQTGRPLPATHPCGRSGFCPAPGQAQPTEISVGHAAFGTATVQGCRGCACQQNGSHRLGADDQRQDLPICLVCGSVSRSLPRGV